MGISLKKDDNRVTVIGGTSSVDGVSVVAPWVDPTTHRLLVDSSGGGTGNVVGPASAVDGHLAVFDGATGKLIKDGGAASGTGTVTNTGGALTANSVVLGAGTNDTKVVAGIITDGASQLTLGVNTTTLGKVKMFGNTSGDVTLQPNAVAGTGIVLTLPATTGTLAVGTIPTAASGATLDGLTDNTQFVTALAVQNGHNVPHAAPGSSGNLLQSNGTDWNAVAVPTWNQNTSGTAAGLTGTPSVTVATVTTTGNIELGNASDTTLARVSAGVVSIEGVNIDTVSGTQTLTNKRITPRILSAASYTTDTGTSINGDTLDMFIVTAQAGALKFNNPTGTPTDGQKLILTVASSTTAARALTWDTAYGATTVALPTTTAATTVTLTIGFIWSASKSLWQCVAVA